jgi:hypothetical protein
LVEGASVNATSASLRGNPKVFTYQLFFHRQLSRHG